MVKWNKVQRAFEEGRSEGIRGANTFVTDGQYLYSSREGKRKYVAVARRVGSVTFKLGSTGSPYPYFKDDDYSIYGLKGLTNAGIIDAMGDRIRKWLHPQTFIRDMERAIQWLRRADELLIAMIDSCEFDDEGDALDALRNKISRGVEMYGMQYRFLLGE